MPKMSVGIHALVKYDPLDAKVAEVLEVTVPVHIHAFDVDSH